MRKTILIVVLLALLPLAAFSKIKVVYENESVEYYEVKSYIAYGHCDVLISSSPNGYSGDVYFFPHISDTSNRLLCLSGNGSRMQAVYDTDSGAKLCWYDVERDHALAYSGDTGYIPGDIYGFEENALDGCFNMSSLTIKGYKLQSFPGGLLKDCNNLRSITIDNSEYNTDKYYYSPKGSVAIIYKSNTSDFGNILVAGCKNTDIPNDVNTIGSGAFKGCKGLTSITIPNSVTRIWSEAFAGTSLHEIVIPSSVKSIGSRAFADCPNLTSVIIEGNVSISDKAFEGSPNITSVTVRSGGISSLSSTSGEYISPFADCPHFTQLTIEEGVTEIGDAAFKGCKGLTSVILPSTLKLISGLAFAECTGLQSVTIGGDGVDILWGAFGKCTGLTDVIIEEGIKNIYGGNLISIVYEDFTPLGAFDGCSNLRSFTVRGIISNCNFINASIPDIHISDVNVWLNSSYAYKYDPRRYRIFLNGEELEHLKIPEGVTKIPGGAFVCCASLKSVTIPNSVREIENGAFYNCDSLLLVMSAIEEPFEFNGSKGILHYASETKPEGYKGSSTTNIYGNIVYEKVKKPLMQLYVPMGKINDYKDKEDWNKFSNIRSWNPDVPLDDEDLERLYPVIGNNENEVTITANSYMINYGSELPEFQYTTTGATLNGTPEITCEASKTSPVGTYPIVISKGTVTNTKTTFVNGTLTITKAPLTIKAGNYTKVEGEEIPSFTLTYDGFKNNETSAVLTKQPSVSCFATKDSPAGSYPVTISSAEAKNYSINYVAGTLTVTAKGGGSGGDNPDAIITIADSKAMAICVEKWDTDGDGKLSKAEAAAVTDIGDTFKGNKELTSLDMLQFFTGLTTIPQSAFSGCTSLKSIRLPKAITTIENYAFCYCYELTSLTIPASVTSIGAYEFEHCHNLSEIIVEEGNTVYDSRNHCNAIIETAENNLLYGCKNTVIPEGVTQSGPYVFYGNEGLTSINIPASMTYINNGLFSKCKNLAKITVADDNSMYDSRNNCNAIIMTSTNDLIQGCRNTIIPNSVVSIHNQAFDDGRAVGKVTIPGNVKTVGDQAFTNCPELKTVIMKEGMETIGYSAFQSCNTLEAIVLPSTLKSIDSRAFANDSKVKFIVSAITTPFEIPGNTFSSCYATATLYVPTGTKSLYEQTPGWQDFTNIVETGTVEIGDANGDNAVNQTDVELVKDYIMEGKTEGLNFKNADANGDYEINAADIVEIVKIKSSY